MRYQEHNREKIILSANANYIKINNRTVTKLWLQKFIGLHQLLLKLF